MDATSLQQTLFENGSRDSGIGYRRGGTSLATGFRVMFLHFGPWLSTLDSFEDFVAWQALALTAEGLECSDADAEAVLMDRGRPP
jgi:hypothetical protein